MNRKKYIGSGLENKGYPENNILHENYRHSEYISETLFFQSIFIETSKMMYYDIMFMFTKYNFLIRTRIFSFGALWTKSLLKICLYDNLYTFLSGRVLFLNRSFHHTCWTNMVRLTLHILRWTPCRWDWVGILKTQSLRYNYYATKIGTFVRLDHD